MEKPLRLGRCRHFGAGGANSERGGALVTGKANAGEGKASEGVFTSEEGQSYGGDVGGWLETR